MTRNADAPRPHGRRRSILLSIGGVGFLAGSIAVGVTATAYASPAPSQPTATVTANQGLPGGVPWPVSGSVSAAQSGSWNVGISGTPTVKTGDQTTRIAGVGGSGVQVAPTFIENILTGVDTSAYKEVTIYLGYSIDFSPSANPISCEATYDSPDIGVVHLGPVNTDNLESGQGSTTFDPAPH